MATQLPLEPQVASMPIDPGPRAKSTLEMYDLALKKVLQVINEKNMKDGLSPLREVMTEKQLEECVQLVIQTLEPTLEAYAKHRWSHLITSHSYIEKSNALDELIKEARQRQKMDKNPRTVLTEEDIGSWKKVSDARTTVRCRTMPTLLDHRERLRKVRQEREASVAALHGEILDLSKRLSTLPKDVGKSLDGLLKHLEGMESGLGSTVERLEGLVQEKEDDDEMEQ
ncbi:hypothetical protein BT69DRAFT_1316831 [Atractiella rhizophila]|nr:hypothetical protein BT69DRAFT_1316831 [Atractiella rhizophila]